MADESRDDEQHEEQHEDERPGITSWDVLSVAVGQLLARLVDGRYERVTRCGNCAFYKPGEGDKDVGVCQRVSPPFATYENRDYVVGKDQRCSAWAARNRATEVAVWERVLADTNAFIGRVAKDQEAPARVVSPASEAVN